MRIRRLASPIVALALAALACDGAAEEPTYQLVARAGDTFVGLVADGGVVDIYVCDGTPSGGTIAAWLDGTHSGGTFEAVGDKVDVHLAGTFDETSLTATLTLEDGTKVEISGGHPGGDDGLYVDVQGDFKGGWLMIEGEQRGAVISRPTGSLVSGSSFNPSTSAVTVMDTATELAGLTFTPTLLLRPLD